MKKELYDLTIEEFVRLLCGMEEVYSFELKIFNDNGDMEKDEIRGTYDEIRDFLTCLTLKHPENKTIQSQLDKIENSTFDYKMQLSQLDVYNYLEKKTQGFDKDRTGIVWHEISMYHCMYSDEERLDVINKKIKNGWKEYKLIEEKNCITGDVYNTIDYKDAYEKEFGIAYDFCYDQAMNLLKNKMEGCDINSSKLKTLSKELSTDEARKWLQVAINGGLLNADYSTTDKTRTKPQKALLAEILSDKIGLDHKYKPFETLWNVSGLSKSRYKSKEEKGIVKGGNVIIEVFKEK